MSRFKLYFLISQLVGLFLTLRNVHKELILEFENSACHGNEVGILYGNSESAMDSEQLVITNNCINKIDTTTSPSTGIDGTLKYIEPTGEDASATDFQVQNKSYFFSTSPYVQVKVETNKDIFKYTFMYKGIGELCNYVKDQENSTYIIIRAGNEPNDGRKLLIEGNSNDVFVFAYIKEENKVNFFYLANVLAGATESFVRKSTIQTPVMDCYIKGNRLICFYFSTSGGNCVKYYVVEDYTDKTSAIHEGEIKESGNPSYVTGLTAEVIRVKEIKEYGGTETGGGSGNGTETEPGTVTGRRRLDQPATTFLVALSKSPLAFLYLIPDFLTYDANVDACKIKSYPYLFSDWGYWNPEIFVLKDINYYAIFNGGATLQFFDEELERLSIMDLDKGPHYINFYGNIMSYLNKKFYMSSIDANQNFLYFEFNIPKCKNIEPKTTYLPVDILSKDCFEKEDGDDPISPFLYILNYQRDPSSKGYFLCVFDPDTPDEKTIYLEEYYQDELLCDTLRYVPVKKGDITFNYRIYSKIGDTLYIPSSNICEMKFTNKCYKNCKQDATGCELIGTEKEKDMQCYFCEPDYYFNFIYYETDNYTDPTSPNEVGDCLEICPDGFFHDVPSDLSQKRCTECIPNCKTCDEKGKNPDRPICLSCNEGYYPLEDQYEMSLSVLGDLAHTFCYDSLCTTDYYFEVLEGKCKKKSTGCYAACKECDTDVLGTKYEMHCRECSLADYDNKSLVDYSACINEENKANFYFEAPYFFYCYDSCDTCETYGIKDRHNCEVCREEQADCIIWQKNLTFQNFKATDRNRTFMLEYLNQNVKVYAKAGFDFRSTSAADLEDGYILQAYYSDYPREMSTYANFLNTTDCELKLREEYKIPGEDSIIITKFDYTSYAGESTTQSEYNFYWEHDPKNLTTILLDASKCDREKITIHYLVNSSAVPDYKDAVMLSQYDINMYDYYNQFYHDQCLIIHLYDSDLSLRHRIKHYYKTASLCEKGCVFIRIDPETEKVICVCPVKPSLNPNNDPYRVPLNTDVKIKNFPIPFEFGYYNCTHLLSTDNLLSNYGLLFYTAIILILILLSIYTIIFEFVKVNSRFEQLFHTLKAKNPFYQRKKKELEHKNVIRPEDLFLNGYVFFLEGDEEEEEWEEEEDDEHPLNTGDLDRQMMDTKERKRYDKMRKKQKEKKNHRKIVEIDYGDVAYNYKLFKRGRMNNYSYVMAEKEDTRKCCELLVSFFKEKFVLLRCLYRQSILEFASFNLTMFVYVLGEIWYLNLLFFTPAVTEEKFINRGSLTITTSITKSFYAFLVSHYILRRNKSLERFASTFEISTIGVKNSDKFVVKTKRMLRAVKRKIIINLVLKFVMLCFFGFSATLFCVTFSTCQMSWLIGGFITIGLDIFFSFLGSIIIALVRYCSIREESNSGYNFSLFLKDYL